MDNNNNNNDFFDSFFGDDLFKNNIQIQHNKRDKEFYDNFHKELIEELF